MNESECGAKISKYVNTPPGSVSALVMAIAENGPISVAIDASHKSFSFYSHGVYYEPECGECAWLIVFSVCVRVVCVCLSLSLSLEAACDECG